MHHVGHCLRSSCCVFKVGIATHDWVKKCSSLARRCSSSLFSTFVLSTWIPPTFKQGKGRYVIWDKRPMNYCREITVTPKSGWHLPLCHVSCHTLYYSPTVCIPAADSLTFVRVWTWYLAMTRLQTKTGRGLTGSRYACRFLSL